ncbi:LPS biosynthesis protein [Sulfolobus sp. A20]|nr:LPS biosynthesis protein [Sulfolobus sp. A20]
MGIVYNNFLSPIFAGGGAVHAYEVISRLKKSFKIIYYPSSTVFIWDKDKLEEKAKELRRNGIEVVDEFFSLLDNYTKYSSMLRGVKKFLNQEKLALEISKQYDVDKVDFLYEPDHTSFDIFYLGKKREFGLTLHVPLFYDDSLHYLKRLMKFYTFNPYTGKGFYTRFFYNQYVKRKYIRLLKEIKPTFVAGVSEGPLADTNLNKFGIKTELLIPGNAFDPELLKYRNRGKEEYIIFWSRLNQDKGLPELPDILKMMSRKVKLIIAGKFFDRYNERVFWNKVKKYGLEVEYLGFLPRDRLNEVVSKAKLFIYPSHVDGFSLVVLEALALGTPVIAYDIPAIRSVYGRLKAVKIVKEFDKARIAEEASKILSLREKEIEDLMNDEELMRFLNLYSSWDNVASAVKKIIEKYSSS